jgi:hypothetical protein
MGSYTAPPISVPLRDVRQVELVFAGVEQAGPSFEARVFLNRADADEDTPRTPETGYAGAFHVYGYGEPEPPPIAAARQRRAAGPAAPIEKRVHADAAAVRTALAAAGELTVTVVSVPADPGGATPDRPFEDVRIVFGAAPTRP